MRGVGDLTHHAGVTADADVDIASAVKVMNEGGCGVTVLLENSVPVGILTERDLLRLLDEDIPFSDLALTHATKPVITLDCECGIDFALNLMIDNGIRRIAVTGADGVFRGVLLQEEIIRYMEDDLYRTNLRLEHLIQSQEPLLSASPIAPVREVISLMRVKNVGAVPVLADGRPVGIVTERDMLRLAGEEFDLDTPVEVVMSSPVYCVGTDELVVNAMKTILEKGMRRIVIIDHEGLAKGIITSRDVLRNIRGNYNRLLETKLRLARATLDVLPEIILEIHESPTGMIIHWGNGKAQECFGTLFADSDVTAFIPAPVWDKLYAQIIPSGTADGIRLELNGRVYEASAARVRCMFGMVIRLILRDVTEREEMNRVLEMRIRQETERRMQHEQLMIQQSKLAFMGQMVGAIAHQWRQPLNSLGLMIQDLEDALAYGEMSPDYIRQSVKKCMSNIYFMSRTIDDFRSFFTPSREKVPFDVRASVRDVLFLMSGQLTAANIRVHGMDGCELKLPENPGFLTVGYPNEFMQVIMNLIANARDAIVKRRDTGYLDAGVITVTLSQTDTDVTLSIADDGGGVRPEHMAEIFEPYFTTKKDGTGIGLYMAKVILEKNMSGSIGVKNGSKGAVFTIRLKRAVT